VDDLDEAPDNEVEAAEEEILDQATAARSIAELRIEIETLKGLESQALAVRRSGTDTKWRELASLLSEIFTPAAIGHRVAEPQRPMAPARSRRPTLRRTRSWSSSPSTATRSTISNSASPRCSAARKPWSSSTAASAAKSA
jgi:hypothetical protein